MDFTEPQVPFLNNTTKCCLIFFCFLACNTPIVNERKNKANTVWVETKNSYLQHKNGSLFYKQLPFTGNVFYMHNATDTAFVKGYLNGLEDGLHTTFFANNQLQEQRYYNNGIKADSLKRWWPNGHLQWLYYFKNGEYQGVCYEWNSQGLLVKKLTYENGYEQGMQTHYYDNGKIKSNYTIINGRRYGLLGTKNCVNVSIKIIPQQ
jgi:antitoxin component YwqK of YwqJK toxin-antitoxin module